MKKIPLTKGKYALVDDADYEWLSQWKWHAINGRYAARREWHSENGKMKGVYILMHRFIMGTPADMDTDHKNGNTLDNRRSNLRICTTAQNLANRSLIKSRNTTGYKGVIFDKTSGRYVAQICSNRGGKRRNTVLGRFESAYDAAIAYELEAQRRYGAFAKLELLGGRY